MARWQPDTAQRLTQAALELYAEHGYDRTTVADIAARAGLTERTYFRYFADKREVLFAGSADLQQAMVGACSSAPAGAGPFEAIACALDAAAGSLEPYRDRAPDRWAIVTASAELQEREVMKRSVLVGALASALRERGVDGATADLVAGAGIAVFHAGYERWIADGLRRPLAEEFREALATLRSVSAAG